MKSDPEQILKSATNILLIDWPDQQVPRALLNAGFTVFGFSPNGYSMAKLVENLPDGQHGFPPRNDTEKGYLVFQKTGTAPGFIDIINIYRPEAEHAGIIEKHALTLKAKTIWLHPPVTSVHTPIIAAQKGLGFIQNISITEAAATLKNVTK